MSASEPQGAAPLPRVPDARERAGWTRLTTAAELDRVGAAWASFIAAPKAVLEAEGVTIRVDSRRPHRISVEVKTPNGLVIVAAGGPRAWSARKPRGCRERFREFPRMRPEWAAIALVERT